MHKDRTFWSEWARVLHESGLADIAALFLDGMAPVRIVFAQAITVCSIFVGESARFTALAAMMEDGDESRSFVAFLREESRA